MKQIMISPEYHNQKLMKILQSKIAPFYLEASLFQLLLAKQDQHLPKSESKLSIAQPQLYILCVNKLVCSSWSVS